MFRTVSSNERETRTLHVVDGSVRGPNVGRPVFASFTRSRVPCFVGQVLSHSEFTSSELSVGDRVLVGGCRQRSMFLMMSGLLPPLKNTTNTSHNELLHQDPLQPPLEPRTPAVSHPTCCCSASPDCCDRCDLLVDLDSFHLTGVARTPNALVLDVESCSHLFEHPGSRLTTQGHGRVVEETNDARWADVRFGSGGTNDAGYAANTPGRSQPSSIRTLGHVPRVRLGVRAIHWAIAQLCFKGAPPRD